MFVTKAKHEAALAEKDATIEGLMARLRANEIAMKQQSEALAWHAKERSELKAQIASPLMSARGKGGRFVKKGVE